VPSNGHAKVFACIGQADPWLFAEEKQQSSALFTDAIG
jgi:hypothetical protein